MVKISITLRVQSHLLATPDRQEKGMNSEGQN